MINFVLSHLEQGCDNEGRRIYSCKLCNMVMSKREKARQHVETVHGNSIGVRFKCSFCEKDYKSHSNLRTHVSHYHRNQTNADSQSYQQQLLMWSS